MHHCPLGQVFYITHHIRHCIRHLIILSTYNITVCLFTTTLPVTSMTHRNRHIRRLGIYNYEKCNFLTNNISVQIHLIPNLSAQRAHCRNSAHGSLHIKLQFCSGYFDFKYLVIYEELQSQI